MLSISFCSALPMKRLSNAYDNDDELAKVQNSSNRANVIRGLIKRHFGTVDSDFSTLWVWIWWERVITKYFTRFITSSIARESANLLSDKTNLGKYYRVPTGL